MNINRLNQLITKLKETVKLEKNKYDINLPANQNIKKNLDDLDKIIDNISITREYGKNICFMEGESYNGFDEDIVNKTCLLLLNKLGSFRNEDYLELTKFIYEEPRAGRKIIAELIQSKFTKDRNKEKENTYFNLVDTYKNYLVNETEIKCRDENYTNKLKDFINNLREDMTIDDVKSLFVNFMGPEFLESYSSKNKFEYGKNRIYDDIAFGKAISDIIGLKVKLNCENDEANTDVPKFKTTDDINTIYDILVSSYPQDGDIITKTLSNILNNPPDTIDSCVAGLDLDFHPEFRNKIREYNNEVSSGQKIIKIKELLLCRQLLIGNRIETLKKWKYKKNSIINIVYPVDIPYTNLSACVIKNFMMDNTNIKNIFPLRLIYPKGADFLYENEFYSKLDPSYKYVGMICVKIATHPKIILIYKKYIDLIQSPNYKFITPFEYSEFSVLIDSSKIYHTYDNSAIQKLQLYCHKNKDNESQDITLKEEYDIFDNSTEAIQKRKPYNKHTRNPQRMYIHKVHVYEIKDSNPKEILFSRYSKEEINDKYLSYGFDTECLNKLKEIPYSNTMINMFPETIGKLCTSESCITYRSFLARTRYYQSKNDYTELISKINFAKKNKTEPDSKLLVLPPGPPPDSWRRKLYQTQNPTPKPTMEQKTSEATQTKPYNGEKYVSPHRRQIKG